jgi:iron complex outermembrane receptor protein
VMRNIRDEEIRLSTSVLREYAPEPGRSFNVGVRMEF